MGIKTGGLCAGMKRIVDPPTPRVPPGRPLEVGRVLIVFVLLLFASCHGSIQGEDRIIVRDGIVHAGYEGRVSARLVRMGGLGRAAGIPGEVLRLSVDGERIGEGLTDVLGVFSCPIPARKAGRYTLTASLVSTKRHFANDAEGLVSAVESRRPVLLVEVDRLFEPEASALPALPLFDQGRGPGVRFLAEAPPHLALGAESTLERLSQWYDIAYLAILEESNKEDLLSWLERMECPRGPLLHWEIRTGQVTEKSIARRRTAGLRRLAEALGGPILGIVGSEEAAKQYADELLMALHLDLDGKDRKGEKDEEEDPWFRQARWKDVGELLASDEFRDPAILRRNVMMIIMNDDHRKEIIF